MIQYQYTCTTVNQLGLVQRAEKNRNNRAKPRPFIFKIRVKSRQLKDNTFVYFNNSIIKIDFRKFRATVQAKDQTLTSLVTAEIGRKFNGLFKYSFYAASLELKHAQKYQTFI